jgi:hypothetical protein
MSSLRRSRRLAGMAPEEVVAAPMAPTAPTAPAANRVPFRARFCSAAFGFVGSLVASYSLARVVVAACAPDSCSF